MYKAFFEYNESQDSSLYKNFISKILENNELQTTLLRIEPSKTLTKFSKIEIQLDILEDFTYELKSNFVSYKEAIGDISGLAGSIISFFDKVGTTSSVFSQTYSKGADNLRVQVWKETEPFRMNFKFSLQTKTNPFIDVYLPVILLTSQTILSPVTGSENTDLYRTPGVNSQKIKKSITINKENKVDTSLSSTERNTNSKVLDTFAILSRKVKVDLSSSSSSTNTANSSAKRFTDTDYKSSEASDGIFTTYNPLLQVDYAFIENAKPTWSKERTESGIPLWCELELTIQSVFSANDSMFSYYYPPKTGAITSIGNAIVNTAVNKSVNMFR